MIEAVRDEIRRAVTEQLAAHEARRWEAFAPARELIDEAQRAATAALAGPI